MNRFVASFVGDNTVLDAQITVTERGAGGTCKVRLPCGTELQAQDINGAATELPGAGLHPPGACPHQPRQ